MSNETVRKWMDFVEDNPELYKELIEKKEKRLANGKSKDALIKFIKNDLIPAARERGFVFDSNDVINYRDNIMKALDDAELAEITGGSSNFRKGVGFGLLAVTLLSAVPLAGTFMDSKRLNENIEYNISLASEKNKDNGNIINDFIKQHSSTSKEKDPPPTRGNSGVQKNFGGPGGGPNGGPDDRFDNSHKKAKETTQSNKKIADLEKSLDNANVKKNQGDDLVKKLQAENARLQQQLNSERTTNKRTQDENAKLQQQLNNQRDENRRLHAENTALKTQASNKDKQIANQEATLAEAQKTNITLQDENTELRGRIDNLNNQLDQAQDAAAKAQANLTAQVAAHEKTIANLQVQLNTANSNNAALQKELGIAKNENADLQGQLDQAKTDLKKAQDASDKLNNLVIEADKDNADLQKELGIAKNENADLQGQLDQAKTAAEQAQNTIVKLQKELKNSDDNFSELLSKKMDEEIKESARSQEVDDENFHLARELDTIKRQVADLQDQLNQAKTEAEQAQADLQKELNIAKDENAALKTENANLQDQLNQRQETIDALRATNADLVKEAEALILVNRAKQ